MQGHDTMDVRGTCKSTNGQLCLMDISLIIHAFISMDNYFYGYLCTCYRFSILGYGPARRSNM